jgi:hypothetical protein
MTTPAAVTAAPPAPAVLKIDNPAAAIETCDRCGGAALWRVVFVKGELLFCGHHAVKNGFVSPDTSHAAYQNENKSKGSDH